MLFSSMSHVVVLYPSGVDPTVACCGALISVAILALFTSELALLFVIWRTKSLAPSDFAPDFREFWSYFN